MADEATAAQATTNCMQILLPLAGTLIGGAITMAAYWLREEYKYRTSVEEWVEEKYVEGAIEPVDHFLAELEDYFRVIHELFGDEEARLEFVQRAVAADIPTLLTDSPNKSVEKLLAALPDEARQRKTLTLIRQKIHQNLTGSPQDAPPPYPSSAMAALGDIYPSEQFHKFRKGVRLLRDIRMRGLIHDDFNNAPAYEEQAKMLREMLGDLRSELRAAAIKTRKDVAKVRDKLDVPDYPLLVE